MDTFEGGRSTPLTSISAFTGILLKNRDKNLTERNVDQLQVMRRNAAQLKTLLGNLLELSDMHNDSYELSYGRFNLRSSLEEVTDAFMPAILKKDQYFNLNIDAADAIVEADDTRVRQVVSNVLTNAIMYSPEHANIKVSAWVTDLLFTVTVSDDGIGIKDRDKEELFTVFFRADNESTRAVSGTGIGLVTAKQIVELHGGELTLTSNEGEGTAVHISMPRFRTRHTYNRNDGAGNGEDRAA
jgi:signal transduction histidine kinase